jgi:membrane-bound lytic murein transglycosylase F
MYVRSASGSDQLSFAAGEHVSLGRYGELLKRYSAKYEVDWRLALAVMRQESSFRPRAVSRRGAFGLMQIMPLTQEEISERIGIPEAKSPRYNIKAGIYHFRTLYNRFPEAKGDDRTKLALAAYNAGLRRVLDARDIARYFGHDPNAWESVRKSLPLLSSKYTTLHMRVWEDGKPRGGGFRGSRETIAYVDNIMNFYNDYQVVLR